MSQTKRSTLLLLIANCAYCASTYSIAGRVTDTSGAVVAQAMVRADSRNSSDRFTATTDRQGMYALTLPQGEYLIEAEAPGLSAAPSAVRITHDQNIDLRLGVSTVASSVIVTATGTSQTLTETGKAVDVVERAEIDQRGIESAGDALRELPGLRLSQRGGPGSFTTIQMRGLRAIDTSVLIDGMRFRDAGSPQGDASAFLSDLLITDTSRIEVLRGSGSSVYGTHAIGGVVNIVTDQGGGPLHGELTVDGGGLGEFRGLARIGGGAFANRLHFSAGAGHQNVTRGVDDSNVYRNTTGNGVLDFVFRPGLKVSARFLGTDVFGQMESDPFAAPDAALPASGRVNAVGLSDAQTRLARLGLPYSLNGATFIPGLRDADSYRTARYASTLLALEQQVNTAVSYRVSYQALLSARNAVDGPLGAGFQPEFRSSSQYNGRLDTLQGRVNLLAASHQLISAGYEFEREYFDAPAYDENPDPASRIASRTTVSERSHSFDVQDQIRLLHDRLQVSLSGRFQEFSLSTPAFQGTAPAYVNAAALNAPNAYTGDASVAYWLRASGTKVRSHIGNGYRKPSLYERFGTYISPFYFAAYGDPRLKPERSISVDAGIDQYFAANRVRLSATYFYTHLQQVIGFDFSGLIQSATDPFGRSAGYYNTGGGFARGVELSMEARPWRSMSVRGSYTYTDARNRISQFADGTLQTARIFPHAFGLVAQQQFGKHVDASFDFSAASDYLYPFNGRTFVFAGPRLAALAGGYTQRFSDHTKVRYYARVANLLDQRYYEDGFRTPGRWAVGGVTLSF